MLCLKISDEYRKWIKSYGGVKNGMLYSENAKIINMRLTIFVTDMETWVRLNHFGTSLLICLVYFRMNTNEKETLCG